MAFHPYLFFGGNCREAFTRYQEIFGGELVLLTLKDVPSEEPVPADKADYVMHAALTYDGNLLMASDDPTTDSFGPVQGMMVSYSVADPGEAKRVFEALAEGGTVTAPIGETFFSPMWGMCTDRFGTPWMIGADAAAAP
jgi:PhnB protein